ncbi:hypothetical protein DXG01_014479 [Tephrocybe rancida]|nr:hypothetical protein DXG01_014479 [Tephrocybe rancida]
MSDGNLTILVGNYCLVVHASVMALESTHFQDMWAQRPNQESGVAVIRFLKEEAADLVHLVNVLYHIDGHLSIKCPLPAAKIASLLYMSDKYGYKRLLSTISDIIRVCYPRKLGSWDSLSTTHTQIEVNRGVEFDLLPIRQIKRGLRRADGSTAALSPEDRVKICIGRAVLTDRAASDAWSWLSTSYVNPDCIAPTVCTRHKAVIQQALFSIPLSSPDSRIETLTAWKICWEAKLCAYCSTCAKYVHRVGRARTWENLPEIFGLGNWQMLKDQELQPREYDAPSIVYEK